MEKSNVLLATGSFVLGYVAVKTLDEHFWGLKWSKMLLFGISVFYLLVVVIVSKKKKIEKWITKTWKYLTSIFDNIKHLFIKKEVLLFQSQEDSNFYWTNEIYIEKKFGFCSMCQGGDILYKDKIKKMLFLTLRLTKIKLRNKIVKNNIFNGAINSFCQDCGKKKIEELENNSTLKNPKKLKKLTTLSN